MAFTSHGHQIVGTIAEPRPSDMKVARCGGPGMCSQCSRESSATNMVTRDHRIRVCLMTSCSLDGYAATIVGYENNVATIIRMDNGERHSLSWDTAVRVADTHGRFKSK